MTTMDTVTTTSERTNVRISLRSPGIWLLVAGIEITILIQLAEFLYPDYSVSEDYISELGVGPALPSAIFALAVMLFGLMAIIAALLIRQNKSSSRMWLLLALSGTGAIGVGLFNMDDFGWPHRVFALTAFLFGNLSALYSWKMVRPPLSFIFAFLGVFGLSALALFGAEVYLGLGIGGMERMILYPAMLWAIGFGSCLLAEESKTLRK